nr:hypothetical protein [Burkholderiaceae bacterium]
MIGTLGAAAARPVAHDDNPDLIAGLPAFELPRHDSDDAADALHGATAVDTTLDAFETSLDTALDAAPDAGADLRDADVDASRSDDPLDLRFDLPPAAPTEPTRSASSFAAAANDAGVVAGSGAAPALPIGAETP